LTDLNQHEDERELDLDEYEGEHFERLTLINTNLRDKKFVDCIFEGCSISSVKIDGALMQVAFKESKLEGINFFTAKQTLMRVSFYNCVIRHCSFAQLKLRDTKFVNCRMQNVDFAETDMTEADFSNSLFEDCVFQHTILTKANFTDAQGYVIDPTRNIIRKAKFNMPDVLGLLSSFDIVIE
jgi:fluoroquinolone resistance protein